MMDNRLSFLVIDLLESGTTTYDQAGRFCCGLDFGEFSIYLDAEMVSGGWNDIRRVYFQDKLVFEEKFLPEPDGEPYRIITEYCHGEWEALLETAERHELP